MKTLNIGDVIGLAFGEAIKMLEAIEEDEDRIEATFTSKSPIEQKYMRGFMNNESSMKAVVEMLKCVGGAVESAKMLSIKEQVEIDPYPLLNTILDAFTEIDERPFKITVSKR